MKKEFPTFREWWGEDLPDVTDEELMAAVKDDLVYARYELARDMHEALADLDEALGSVVSRLLHWLGRLGL